MSGSSAGLLGVGYSVGGRAKRVPVFITAMVGSLMIIQMDARASEDVRTLAREALANAQSQLRSGRGKAKSLIYDAGKKLIQETHMDFAFDGAKYYLKMEFRLTPQPQYGCDRKFIVCDGSATFANCFSPKIRPAGCETSVYRADANMSTVAEGFPHDFRCLSKRFDRPEEFDKREFRFEKLSNGHYQGTTVLSPDYSVVLELAPEAGWNIVLTRGVTKSGKYDVVTAEWKRDKGIWFINALTQDEYRRDTLKLHKELRCTEFKVNVPVSARLFTMDALEICARSRIIDRRPDAKVRIYKPAQAKSAEQTKVDTMLSQLDRMSPRFPLPEPPTSRTGQWRIAIIVFNIAAVLTIGLVWCLRRRSHRTPPSGISSL